MTPELLSQLLTRSESDVLDFKVKHYDLGQSGDDPKARERKRAKLAKDLLAFANLWRGEPRYIIIGAKPNVRGGVDSPGIDAHVDGAEIVAAVEGLVYPCPRFHYEEMNYGGVQYGIIEIPFDRSMGPFFAAKDIGGGDGTAEPLLRRNALYCRRDSRNVEASGAEQEAIWAWFTRKHASPVDFPSDELWARLVDLAQFSDPQSRRILILALADTRNDPRLSYLGSLDWTFVVDLDPASQFTGALKHCRDRISARRALHVVVSDGPLLGDIGRSTCWLFANGLQVSQDPVPEIKYKDWVVRYGRATASKVEQIAAACVGPISVVAICEDPQRTLLVRRLLEDIAIHFGDRASAIAIAVGADDWRSLEQHELAQIIPLRTGDLLDGLASHARVAEAGLDNTVQFPGSSGVPKDVPAERQHYLEEDLELVHLASGTRADGQANPIRSFLRGGQISWFELGLQCDVERGKTGDLLKLVEQDIARRRSSRINLFHEAGAGGSTIARRVIWNLHRRYPCVAMRRCAPRETAERITWIYQTTGQPVIILREGSDVPETEAGQLADLLAANHLPFVMLQVLRRYAPPAGSPRSIYLRAELDGTESERFKAVLAHEMPVRASQLEQLAKSDKASRTPFLFGLTAFAEEFTGLRSYVRNHLQGVPTPQMKVLQFLALAYTFGQQALDASHFGEFLQVPKMRRIDFNKLLCAEARGLLVQREDGHWRPMHQLVSSEILEVTLTWPSTDTRQWRLRLGDLAREFVDFCRGNGPVPPDDLRFVLEQVCVRRDDAELLGGTAAGEKAFARLVTDLPTSEAKLRLFEHLVKVFPDNPHFWAHLGRYYSIDRKDFAKAEEAIDHAIALNERDHVLHHMKGMVLRNLAYQGIAEKQPIEAVLAAAKRASDSFDTARKMAPEEDYGYISDVQMTLRVLDYARGSKDATTTLAQSAVDPWLREGFERVETLLRAVRDQHRGEVPSEYEEKCRADLDVLYGSSERALQRWDDLLQRKTPSGQPSVYAPPVRRQIVWLQLARSQRRWEDMPPKNLERALVLLESNIQEEPEDDRNIRLWLQGARFLQPPPSLLVAADRIATWRMRGDSLDATYYLYILKVLEAFDGSTIAAVDAQRNMEACKAKAGFRRDRLRSFEWLGIGTGLRRLVHQDQLGEWDDTTGFWANTKPLLRMDGIISKIYAPQAGEIELRFNLKAFFAPAVAGMAYGQDENRPVTFYLGFSYEGLRAWSVKPVGRDTRK